MARLGRLPTPGEHVTRAGHRFEVVDMDGRRIDQVLVTRLAESGGPGDAEDADRRR